MGGAVAALNPGALIASGAASLGNSIIQADATRRAGNQAADAQRNALASQERLFNQTQAEAQPFLQGGQGAYQALLRTYGLGPGGESVAPDFSAFTASPDYAFAKEQGQQQLDRQASARGNLYSGQQIKAGQRFGQGLATQFLGNYRTGLQGLSNTGTNALASLAGARAGYSNQVGQGMTNLGDIQAAGTLGRAQIYGNALNQLGGAAGYFGTPGTQGGGQASSFNPGPIQNVQTPAFQVGPYVPRQ